jgi:hypothetical protein
MGSDVYVYFTQARDQGVAAAELEELAEDSGRSDTGASGDTVVARLDAATGVREGGDAELWVDGRSMHVFDPATGRNLSLSAADDGGTAARVTPSAAASGEANAGPAARAGQADSGEPVSGGTSADEGVT